MSNEQFPTMTRLSMSLYEDEIDWDADLFSQIGKQSSDNKQLDVGQNNGNDEMTKQALDDDSQWGMEPSPKSNGSVQSMRDQMKQSWGGVDKKEEGKPTADWMPGYGSAGPDEDEPWFTG
eukprot:CAMPEP_0181097444 /NCGR_PEP_ID=MMETSP1071-20121207/11572_1 /TAXON_ID=35127 /ORGANISM="Thalassiosira sp., Strain NH16" /LENGTH=119 /DNA_ID=CAMNT_0023179925 /DNA_START=329 /DNA_END=688 /DNA_ORIENTATION=-